MSKEIYISSTPHETRLAIVENDALAEIYYERENEYTLAGSIYNGRVTRVLPGMQSSFVDIGLERDAFLYITDFMEEAGETADFDAGDGRSERSGSRRDGKRRERGRSERNQAAPTPSREEPEQAAESGAWAGGAEAEADTEQIGEGAPGADETRRWRGRRGRRRGRNGSPQAETEATAEVTVDTASAAPPDVPLEERRPGRHDGSRGEDRRDERGGRNGDRDRTGRRDSVRDRFAPRAARFAGEGGDEALDLQASAAQPFILPGESLSKYRRADPAAAADEPETRASAAPANLVAARPSTLVETTLDWDGGFVLPGESLSRRGGARSSRRDPAVSKAKDAAESLPAPSSEASWLAQADAVLPAVTSQHEPEPFDLPAPAEVTAFESQPDPETTFDAASAVPEQHGEPHEPAEYEPQEDDSATFRVDPAPPSEFRQPAPASDAEESHDRRNDNPVQPLFHAEETDAYVESGAFTSLQDSGEMLSAPVNPVVHPAEHADAPIEHEAAVQSVTLHEAELTASAPQFAPGDGVLEEEVLDEEEGELAFVEAAGFDDTEEETLEGAADLGSMLREMSIDEMTQADEPSDVDEDDDYEFDEGELQESEADPLLETSEEEQDDNGFSGSDVSEAEEDEFAESSTFDEPASAGEGDRVAPREGERRGRREGGRRGREHGQRERRGMPNGRSGGRMSRHSAQTTNLPAISDLLKPGQEVLVQIAKEPIAKKGARITSHIALPGRFLVFMPTVSHVGVSRKIESDAERRRLKEVLLSEKGEASGGFIVRTAASGASEEELRSDLRFLLNLWADIKQRSDSSKSPALIYHDLNLVERILRDQVTDNFTAIWVDTESEYERVLRFLQRFQPSLVRRVKLYTKETPLFEQFGITEEINKALRSKVWLKSGGSIVINQTEALVAIDINTGKYVGKTARLEDTIVKTNLDAIPEIVRQIRLRDLGGIIIIDFIDMDERKNRQKVMLALEEELKSDRAPSKVLQFNDFGLVAITRKRVKQSLERTLSHTCAICQGTGMVKSPVTVCNDIYIEMRKMQRHLDRGDVMLRVHPDVVKQLKSPGTKWLQEMEDTVGKTILVKSDPSLHPEQFDIH